MKKYVTYLDFGAKGDGITDDFAAIFAAHEYANEQGLPVYTNDAKTYLIRDTNLNGEIKSATIKTDVNWGTSKFIIDDTDITSFDENTGALFPIFKIEPYADDFELRDSDLLRKLGSIDENTKTLSLSLGYSALVVLYNEDKKVYHRYGSSYISGGGQSSPQNEIILIDDKGNISESTPLMFSYEHITKVKVIRNDIPALTICGGIFITYASQINAYDNKSGTRSKYLHRNILINRSFTTLKNVKHFIENEVSLEKFVNEDHHGAHYWGFFNASFANEITLENCTLTARRSYRFSSYEFHADHVNKIRLIGCVQSNFFVKDEFGKDVFSMSPSPITKWPRCWGIGGTNFCKNMEYIDCCLSRFDAHQGLYNGKILNSTINFMEIIGKGELIFENSEWYSPCAGNIYNSFVYLRDDFGSTWNGTIILKNSKFYVSEGDAHVLFHSYTNWDYGYKCHFPNLILDGITVEGLSCGAKLHIVNEKTSVLREPCMHLKFTKNIPPKDYSGKDDIENMINLNPIIPPEFIRVINEKDKYSFLLSKCDFFQNTDKTGIVEKDIL